MPFRAVVCEVCDKVGRPTGARADRSLPPGWRRITISNPVSLRKRGMSGVICSKQCGAQWVNTSWDVQLVDEEVA